MLRSFLSPGRLRRALAAAVAASPLTACSGTALVDALTPTSGYSVEHDLRYGQNPRQALDLYVPDGAGPEAPLVVFFFGGNWERGSKELYRFVGQAFASRGYLTAVPNYRLYPEVRYPEFIVDGAAAVAWLREREPGRPIHLAGHSAGAYIAVMVALDSRWRPPTEAGCRPVASVVGLAGPYDFLPLNDPTLEAIFGPGPAGPDTQPINQVSPDAPPMLLLTGAADSVVRPRNSFVLARRLRAQGVEAEAIEYPLIGHVGLIAALAAPLRFVAPVLDDSDRFMRGAAVCAAAAPTAQAARTNGIGR